MKWEAWDGVRWGGVGVTGWGVGGAMIAPYCWNGEVVMVVVLQMG